MVDHMKNDWTMNVVPMDLNWLSKVAKAKQRARAKTKRSRKAMVANKSRVKEK